MIRPYMHKNGFTIVELLIVIVVIAILAAVTYVSYASITKDAQVQGMQNDLQSVAGVLNKFKSTKGAHPKTLAEVSAKTTSGATFTYRRDYSTGTFCLQGVLKGDTKHIESSDRTATDGDCPIVNIVANPSAESNATGMAPYSSAVIGYITQSGAASGNRVFYATTNSTTSAQGAYHLISDSTIAGIVYSCSISIKATADTTMSLAGRFNTFANAYLSEGQGGKSIAVTTAWQRFNTTFTAPTGAGKAMIQYRTSAAVSGVTIYSDALICTEGSTVFNFGDGSKSGWQWLGSTNLSPSKGQPL